MSVTLALGPRPIASTVLIASAGNNLKTLVEIFTLTRNPHSPWLT